MNRGKLIIDKWLTVSLALLVGMAISHHALATPRNNKVGSLTLRVNNTDFIIDRMPVIGEEHRPGEMLQLSGQFSNLPYPKDDVSLRIPLAAVNLTSDHTIIWEKMIPVTLKLEGDKASGTFFLSLNLGTIANLPNEGTITVSAAIPALKAAATLPIKIMIVY